MTFLTTCSLSSSARTGAVSALLDAVFPGSSTKAHERRFGESGSE